MIIIFAMNINYFAFLSFIKKMSLNSGNNSIISFVIFCKSSSLLFFYIIRYIYQTNLINLILSKFYSHFQIHIQLAQLKYQFQLKDEHNHHLPILYRKFYLNN